MRRKRQPYDRCVLAYCTCAEHPSVVRDLIHRSDRSRVDHISSAQARFQEDIFDAVIDFIETERNTDDAITALENEIDALVAHWAEIGVFGLVIPDILDKSAIGL